jgi:hypothetical protein
MESVLANIAHLLINWAGEIVLSIVFLLFGRKWRQRLVADVRDEVVASLREEYVRLDYPNAKPISDINLRLDELAKIARQMQGGTDETP